LDMPAAGIFAAFSGALLVAAALGPAALRAIDRHGGRTVLVCPIRSSLPGSACWQRRKHSGLRRCLCAAELPQPLRCRNGPYVVRTCGEAAAEEFLQHLASRLEPGATIFMIDQSYVEGCVAAIVRRDSFGNQYQWRRLGNGRPSRS
jgi:hypothetical protein